MTTAQVVETSLTVNNNSPIQDYVHRDDQTQPTWVQTFHSYWIWIKLVLSLVHYKKDTTIGYVTNLSAKFISAYKLPRCWDFHIKEKRMLVGKFEFNP